MNLHRGFGDASRALAEWVKSGRRLAILAVGNPLRRDDGVGIEILKSLKASSRRVKMVCCLQVPENYLGEVISFKPDRILFIDGVDANLPPGELVFAEFTGEERIGPIISTHGLPLDVSAGYLKASTGASVALLGVQVSSTEFGEGLTGNVERAARATSRMLSRILSGLSRGKS
ncbi:MAG: hydrogenase maturation protease [Candidatus Bathyarchaeia archaeon]